MKRSEFINNLFEFLVGAGSEFINAFRNESWHYKDLRISGFDPHKIYKGVDNLQQRRILTKTREGQYRLTRIGKRWFDKKLHRNFRNQRMRWDGKWRFVMFDIPQELHKQRVAFRQHLQQLGFYQLQKSVYVIPYSCDQEISDICTRLKIDSYVDTIIAYNTGMREEEIRRLFAL